MTIDLSKAFDTVDHDIILDKLRYELPEKWWLYIKNCYDKTHACIEQDNEVAYIDVKVGTRQGAPSSPKLFSIYINALIDQFRSSGLLAKLGNKFVGLLCYADDIILLTEDKPSLQKLADQLLTYCKTHHLKVNETKCEYIVFNRRYDKEDSIILNDLVLTAQDKIKYLGVYISYNLNNEYYIADRKAKANVAYLLTHKLGSNLKCVNFNVKQQIFKTYIRPVLHYAFEVMNLCQSEIEAFIRIEHTLIKVFSATTNARIVMNS